MDKGTALVFADNAYSSDKERVLMKITIENETGKHYICLDRPDYTCYPEEREVLL